MTKPRSFTMPSAFKRDENPHSQPLSLRIERVENPHDVLARLHDGQQYQLPASAYRLLQAEELLREMGYTEQADGTWLLP